MSKAVFSNGFEDTYKGNRNVTAAWAIIEKATGEVYKSGHSLDAAKAQKTAESNLPRVHFVPRRSNGHARMLAAQKFGCTPNEAVARMNAENAAKKEQYRIEVVAL